MNFFEYYGLPLSLELDKADLRKRYYAKSRDVHPDLSSTDSEQMAAINNEAYRVLGDEDARIRHILSLNGINALDQEQLPPDFLMEMMEINEEIMEAEDAEAAKTTLDKVRAFEAGLNESIFSLRQIWPSDPPKVQEALTQLKIFVIKKKYLLRMSENLSRFAPASQQTPPGDML